MSIGKRIKHLRGKESRRAFGHRIGVVENTLRNYEEGMSLPNSDVLAEIARNTGCQLDWLILGEEIPVSGRIDRRVLADSLAVVEEYLEEEGRALSSEAKAALVSEIYRITLEDEDSNPVRLLKLIRHALATGSGPAS